MVIPDDVGRAAAALSMLSSWKAELVVGERVRAARQRRSDDTCAALYRGKVQVAMRIGGLPAPAEP